MTHLLTERLSSEFSPYPEPPRILVAVSGGADSMALLCGLLKVRRRVPIELHVGHLDHQLRGAASREDADWVERTCGELKVPHTIGRIDVSQAASRAGKGIEEGARDIRYGFLEKTALEANCNVIALAHTADDQAETILHHILRGTGLAGLRGIPLTRQLDSGIRLQRPLLEVDRATVLDFLSQIKQNFRDDETNGNEAYTRNRIRRQLLPLLKESYNPQISEALLRLGRQAREAQQAIDEVADDLLERTLESSSDQECRLKWQPFQEVPRHLIRETLALLWRRVNWPRQKMGFYDWEGLADIVLEGGRVTLPARIDARREGRCLVLRNGSSHIKK